MDFQFKQQHDFDLHIALEVSSILLKEMLKKGKSSGIETRGIVEHNFIDSIYFRDPNGYVVELTAPRIGKENNVGDDGDPRAILAKWSSRKRANT